MALLRLIVEVFLAAVVASAERRAGDALALAQWSYRVSPAALDSGPSLSFSAPLPAPTDKPYATPNSTDQEQLVKALWGAFNESYKFDKSRKPDVNKFMQLLQAMVNAAQSDAFMGNFTWLYRSWHSESQVYTRKVEAAVENLVALAKAAQGEELPFAFVSLFNNITNETVHLKQQYHEDLETASVALPAIMQELMNKYIDADLEALEKKTPAFLKLLPSNLNESELCVEAGLKISEVRTLAENSHLLLKASNATFKMMPMLRDYLQRSHPDVAERVYWLIDDYSQHAFGCYALGLESQELILSDVTPVLNDRLRCHLQSAGAPRLVGKLVLLAAAAAWLWH